MLEKQTTTGEKRKKPLDFLRIRGIVNHTQQITTMEVTLNETQSQVDAAIEIRIKRLAEAAYIKANRLPNGRYRKKHVQYTLPQEVTDLLELRQRLYKGEDPEAIMATITGGAIQHAFMETKK